jgi:integrase
VVIQDFLQHYEKSKKTSMLKKHGAVLPMMLEVIGDKPVSELRQVDLRDFFALLANLPPRWKDKCRQLNLSVRELAELEHDETLGPKSFEDTYLASVRPFLKAARVNYQDQGFPANLTIDGIEYIGDRVEGESKQRAFKLDELKRLFEGAEIKRYAEDPTLAHCYWLPHIGLFTGARVNEICQINPQTDIIQDKDFGIWHFWITAESEGDQRIKKSVKTGDDRRVPIHKKLVELGFLDYVNYIKGTGAKMLFPQWQPVNKRASGEAEDWFRKLLRDTSLRDETPKMCLLGMHAFRHTLLTYGAMQKPPLSLFCITGHAQEEAPIHATGAGKGYLTLSLLSPLSSRAEVLDQLDYGLNFIKPIRPA